jgi:hypothetical protein
VSATGEFQTLVRSASAQDTARLLELFGALADYEHLRGELTATESQLREALFGERPVAEALLAERGGKAVGYAVFFPTFSTFLARSGIWLEDLFVLPARVPGRGGRLEWAALDWNELALGFYRGIGARTMDEWTSLRLDGEALVRLAAESADHD